jgi:hypothetical protein
MRHESGSQCDIGIEHGGGKNKAPWRGKVAGFLP